jgi:hypothetical protein
MKAKVLILFGFMLIPMKLFAQNDYWFKKGMDEKKSEKQIEYFTKSIETEGAKAQTYLHRGDAYMNLGLDRVYNHPKIDKKDVVRILSFHHCNSFRNSSFF